ncbi:hypothetical protein CBM2589_A90059 [Cupriavidus taiwanensis]|uniref:Uncharacterized protein n=1 Tax=Cupriavidus taiwanensis TaxID=164546 RepID=A0A975XFF4_9BURK|nr:hypothetical protein CBM2589_A90059 [Cupriavidus taiwanensis]
MQHAAAIPGASAATERVRLVRKLHQWLFRQHQESLEIKQLPCAAGSIRRRMASASMPGIAPTKNRENDRSRESP